MPERQPDPVDPQPGHAPPSAGHSPGSRVLLLNATFEPLSVVPARRAVCLVLADKAEVVEDDGTVLRSAEAFGLQEVHLIRSPQPFLASQRVAQGTQRWVDVVEHASEADCVVGLRARGYRAFRKIG